MVLPALVSTKEARSVYEPGRRPILSLMNESRKTSEVVVIGAGAIGMAVARRLLKRGADVTTFDRQRPGSSATSAAGGMLAPLGESPEAGPFLEAGWRSLQAYPALAEELREETGIDVCLRHTGKLIAAFDETGVSDLEGREWWQSQAGYTVELIDGEEVRRLEPGVEKSVLCALHTPTDSHVDNRLLGVALAKAVTRAGGTLRADHSVESVLVEGDRVVGVRDHEGAVTACETVVVAAGAWSGTLGGLPRPLPVRPVRGQMIRLRLGSVPPTRLLSGPGVYLIPLGGARTGEILIGASQEEADFEIQTDPDTLARLREAAGRFFPNTLGGEVIETWAGLRPGTPDGLPIMGPDPEIRGLHYATGHFRNGILLTPITATALESSVLDGGLPPELETFAPQRFLVL